MLVRYQDAARTTTDVTSNLWAKYRLVKIKLTTNSLREAKSTAQDTAEHRQQRWVSDKAKKNSLDEVGTFVLVKMRLPTKALKPLQRRAKTRATHVLHRHMHPNHTCDKNLFIHRFHHNDHGRNLPFLYGAYFANVLAIATSRIECTIMSTRITFMVIINNYAKFVDLKRRGKFIQQALSTQRRRLSLKEKGRNHPALNVLHQRLHALG